MPAAWQTRFDPTANGPVSLTAAVRAHSALPVVRRTDLSIQHEMRQGRPVRTYSPKPGEITRRWHVIDATDVVLGRLASHAAQLLRGKHKPIFAPHVDTGDFVIIVNASKVALTGNKRAQKVAYRHSGYPGGLKRTGYEELLNTRPDRAVEIAVLGIKKKKKLGRAMLKKLKVYGGPDHPHAAQQPEPFEITQVAQ